MHSIKRSTLGQLNKNRNHQVFEDLANLLIHETTRNEKTELTELLYLLDASPIPLMGKGFDWTEANRCLICKGLKLHLLYNLNNESPSMFTITNANINVVSVGQKMEIELKATYIFDKGYTDYNCGGLALMKKTPFL